MRKWWAAAFCAVVQVACAEFYRGELNSWGTTPMVADAAFAGVWKVTLQATSTDAVSEYKFDQLGDWVFNWGAGTVASADSSVGLLGIGGGNLSFSQTPRYYTFQMTADHLRHVLMTTTNPPVSLLSQTNDAAGVLTGAVAVTVGLSAPRSDNERVWVRWSTNEIFTPNHLALATGAGSVVTAQLPAQAPGTKVWYYVLSSTMPSNVIQADADLCTMRGLNVGPLVSFSYTVAVENVASPRPSVNCGWEGLTPYPSVEDYADVAFGAGYFVMAGKRGTILASTNGAWPWTFAESGTEADLTAVIWDGSRFVAVAPGVMLFSSNALNWTTQSVPSFSSPSDIAYGNGRYVVVQGGANILTSTDTVNWVSMPIPDWAYGVTWGNNEFMAVGYGYGNVLRSPDGLVWVTNSVASDYFDSIQDVAWSPSLSRYVVVGGTYGGLYASANGVAWSTNGYMNLPLKAVTWIPSRGEFVAVGQSNNVLRSSNGLSWLIYTPYTYERQLEGIAYGNSRYVTVGTRGGIMTSPDGLAWTTEDGAWTYAALRALLPFKGRLVVAGDSGVILNSLNAYDFFPGNSGVTNDLLGLATNGSMVVAVGREGRILTSANGSNWTARTSPVSVPLRDVIWFGTEFLAVGDSGTLVTSTNGTNWTVRASGVAWNLYGVARNAGTVVGVGSTGRALVSTNGVDWTEHLVANGVTLTDVTWDGARFYAAGSATPVYASYDGRSWTPSVSHPSASGAGLAWTGDQLVRVDDNGRTFVSYDGDTWWTVPGSYSTGLYAVATFSNRVFAAGGGGNVLANWNLCSDVRAWVSDVPDPVGAGSNLVYTVAMTNFGTLDAADVTVVLDLPVGLSNTTAGVSQGSLELGAGAVTAYFGAVVAGYGGVLSVTTTPTAAGVLTGGAQSKTVRATSRVLAFQYYNVPTNTDVEDTVVYNAAAAGAPGFTTPLFNRTNYLYDSLTLTGVATGVPAVSYSWWFNGARLYGQTGTSYSIANVQSNSAGLYELMASNLYGIATSRCLLSVTSAPVIEINALHRGWYSTAGTHTNTDNSTWVGVDESCFFGCSYARPRSYFIFNVSGQPASSSAVLRLEVAEVVSRGATTVLVQFREVTNTAADVEATQVSNLIIRTDLGDGSVYAFYNVPSNTVPGTVLNIPLSATAVDHINRGGHFVVGLNGTSSSTSDQWVKFSLGNESRLHQLILQTATPPTIATSPASVTGLVGQTVSFCASGNSPISLYYQWRENGVQLPGATGSCLSVSNIALGMQGYQYDCLVSNLAGVVTSAPAVLAMIPGLVTTQPVDGTFGAGARGGLRAVVSVVLPTAYQWQRFEGGAWVDVPGAVDPSFLPAPLVVSDGGLYRLLASNAAGVVTSATATLTVEASPYVVDPLAPAISGVVNDALETNGTGYVGGSFSDAGAPRRYLVAYDPVTAEPRKVPDFDGTVRAAVSDGSGGWYVGGEFLSVDGYARQRLARIKADGTLDLQWRPFVNGTVYALDVRDGVVYAGGGFNTVNGVATRGRLAAFDATTGVLLAWSPVANGTVLALRADATRVYAGGTWNTVETNVPRRYLAAWDRATAALLPWAPDPNSSVYTLDLDGSKLYAGGYFTSVGTNAPATRQGAAAYDVATLSLDAWSPVFSGAVLRLLARDGTVYAAGSFNAVGTNTALNRAAAVDATTGVTRAWQAALTAGSQPINGIAAYGASLYLVGGHRLTNGLATNRFVTAVDIASGATLPWTASIRSSSDPAMVAADSQRVLVGGAITLDGWSVRPHLLSFDVTSGALHAWNPTLNSQVNVLLPGNGALWAGGSFTLAGQTNSRPYLARWDTASGDLLPVVVSNLGSSVRALARDGTNLLVGGDFLGPPVQRFVQVDEATGNPRILTNGFDSTVWDLLVRGTNVYVAGQFGRYVTGPRYGALCDTNGLARLADWPVFNNQINAIVPDGEGGWFVGGYFRQVGGVSRSGLVRLQADGSPHPSWTTGVDNAGAVFALAIAGSHLYVGGSFATLGGSNVVNLGRVDLSTGAVDGWNPSPNSQVNALHAQPGRLYVGGYFSFIAGQSRGYAAAFDTATGSLNAWSPNFDSLVSAIVADGSRVHVAGDFGYHNNYATFVGRFATVDDTTGLTLLWTNQLNNYSRALALGADGLYVGGDFSTVAGVARSRIAKLDRTNGALLGWAPVLSNSVYALTVRDGVVYAGGVLVGGSGSLVGLDAATGAIQPGPGFGSVVHALAVQSNRLAVGGSFLYAESSVRGGLARLDRETLALDTWNPGFGERVMSLAEQGGTLYAGGYFTNVGPTGRRYVAALNADDGAVLPLASSPSSFVNSLALAGDALAIGGDFQVVSGGNRVRWARVDAASGSLLPGAVAFSNGTVNRVRAIGSNIWVGGSFSHVNGYYRPGLAVLKPSSLPVLTLQPAGTTVFENVSASMTADATSASEFRFTWQRFNGAGWVEVAGSGSNLFFNPATVAASGSYRVVVGNAAGSVTSDVALLQVIPTNLPSVVTVGVLSNGLAEALVRGSVAPDASSSVTNRGICWGVSADPDLSQNVVAGGAGFGDFDVLISGLAPGGTYHARAFAQNQVGTAYGSNVMWSAPCFTGAVAGLVAVASNTTSLTLAWPAVPGASGYELQVGLRTTTGGVFISQYYEGVSSDRWIELFNAGEESVNLTAMGLRLGCWNNDRREAWKTNGAPNTALVVTGTVPARATYLIRYDVATAPTNAATPNFISGSLAMSFNGDDTLCLYTGSTYALSALVDALGISTSTLSDASLARRSHVYVGATATSDWSAADWTNHSLAAVNQTATNTDAYLGFHNADLVEVVQAVYTGLSASGAGVVVTGLSAETSYEITLRATNAFCATPVSAVVTARTAAIVPDIRLLGTNGALLANGAAASAAAGTDFGDLAAIGETLDRALWVTNAGVVVLNLTSATVTGTGAGDFTVLNYPATVSPGARSNLVVRFDPSIVGARTVTLEVASNDPDTPLYSVGLMGAGIDVAAVTTAPPAALNEGAASGGGDVLTDGGSAVTARGLCWSTNSPPTLADACTTNGSGVGVFNGTLSGLVAGQTYYVRAYAINGVGTYYGNLQVYASPCFTSPPSALAASATGSTSFTAAWTARDGASGYRLDVSSSSNFAGGAGAPELLFRETMGTPGGTTTLASHEGANGFDNDAFTMSSGGAANPADIRVTSPSTNYADAAGIPASGAGNVFFTSTVNNYGFAIAGIPVGGYSGLTLGFAYRKESSSTNATFVVEWSTNNGAAWNPITVSGLPAPNAGTGWTYLSNLAVSASGTNLSLRWVKSGSIAMRIDDVVLHGVGTSAPTYVPGYSNRFVSGSSEAVTGLVAATTYYVRVRAAGAGACVSGESATQTVTTLAAGPDLDNDGLPDWWESLYGLSTSVSNPPTSNADGDALTDWEEYVADTHPTNGSSFFPAAALSNAPVGALSLVVNPTSTGRVYGVHWNTNLLANPQAWTLLPPEQTGSGGALIFTVTNEAPGRHYRTGVRLP